MTLPPWPQVYNGPEEPRTAFSQRDAGGRTNSPASSSFPSPPGERTMGPALHSPRGPVAHSAHPLSDTPSLSSFPFLSYFLAHLPVHPEITSQANCIQILDAGGPNIRQPPLLLVFSRTLNKSFDFLCLSFLIFIFVKDFIYSFLERGEEKEREGKRYQCGVASHAPGTGDQARTPGMCPDWESNWCRSQPTPNPLSYTSQGKFLYL